MKLTLAQARRRYGIVLEPLANGGFRWRDLNDPYGPPGPEYRSVRAALKAQEDYASRGLPRDLTRTT